MHLRGLSSSPHPTAYIGELQPLVFCTVREMQLQGFMYTFYGLWLSTVNAQLTMVCGFCINQKRIQWQVCTLLDRHREESGVGQRKLLLACTQVRHIPLRGIGQFIARMVWRAHMGDWHCLDWSCVHGLVLLACLLNQNIHLHILCIQSQFFHILCCCLHTLHTQCWMENGIKATSIESWQAFACFWAIWLRSDGSITWCFWYWVNDVCWQHFIQLFTKGTR